MSSKISEIYQKLIKNVDNFEHPRILINACSHGNEILGLKVIEKLKFHTAITGSITYNIGNPKALEENKRYIDADLNRSFPGDISGNYEQQIAAQLMEYIQHFDYVIDIHSTVSGMEDCLIIEDNSPEIQEMVSVCRNAKTVLQMSVTKGSSIFAATRLSDRTIPAIAFEYGDNDDSTTERTYQDIAAILSKLGIIDFHSVDQEKIVKPIQFECYEVYPKQETDITNPKIKNYSLVQKGEVVGFTREGECIISDSNFYPILFGENNYTTIFGFKARKL